MFSELEQELWDEGYCTTVGCISILYGHQVWKSNTFINLTYCNNFQLFSSLAQVVSASRKKRLQTFHRQVYGLVLILLLMSLYLELLSVCSTKKASWYKKDFLALCHNSLSYPRFGFVKKSIFFLLLSSVTLISWPWGSKRWLGVFLNQKIITLICIYI